ncbi:3-deoxy-7-phosphoheptulonate synthase [Micromonospora sp. KC723]|uniref:3-deoxy-7-phosphoheptulonate synthase n=1 Tax=Micromonospora sp. KC723 TaxID=2530381 RepID=UPI001044CF11|nr:3-deoxy-7-phosphoheptulonate synthase [Micromonospora sp. KC723]TDB78117.1 phospho-2-dehydro-3-deoxyheptonate aldolase [Micromonospora sp. KC723]
MIGTAGTAGSPALTRAIAQCAALPALQQPDWEDADAVQQMRDHLAELPPLVTREEVLALRALLRDVAEGRRHVVQSGDCAEDPAECTHGQIARKATLIDMLASAMWLGSRRGVVRVGRIAGQFAKPRSQPTELVGGRELPVFRGHLVNSPEPHPELRRPDPKRLLSGYWAASTAMEALRGRLDGDTAAGRRTWTSHEALLLDYELPMLRDCGDGELILTSTHWPWIGDRTRQLDGAHLALLAAVANPVACKVGPSMSADELVRICDRLDPHREPGRLCLIARMGAETVMDHLPALVDAVRANGHPVIWLCDPMHGNTVVHAGVKTRFVRRLAREVRQFRAVVEAGGAVAGGLHLETTPDQVHECVLDEDHLPGASGRYTSKCDPRLNPEQAVAVVSAWHE